MTQRSLERLGAVAGLVASLTVGVPVLLRHLQGDVELLIGPAWVWWAAYLGYLAAFVAIDRVPQTATRLSERRLLAAQVVLGGAAFALAPGLGWTPVLLVVTAVTAAYVLSIRATALLVVGQALWVAAVWVLDGIPLTDATLGMLVYGSLQAFGVLMVHSGQREAQARARLAEANAELRAATALLAESSRTDERLRIARDIHDLVGHQLTGLALELEIASHRATPPVSEHVARARRIAKDLLADVRVAVGQLRTRPPPLRAALEALTVDLPRPRVHLEVTDHLEVDQQVTAALVRCVQEILTNAMRHADAENLWIDISTNEDGATLLHARDDGRGAPALRLGNGLTGMRERIEQLGGAVTLDHTNGFRVTAEVPAP